MGLSFSLIMNVVLLVLPFRLLWLLAKELLVQAWLWRDCLDRELVSSAGAALPAFRRRLFWSFVRERILSAVSPLCLVCRSFSLRERGMLVLVILLQALATMGLLLPVRVLGLPANVLLCITRRICIPLQQRFDEVAFSEAALKRQTLEDLYRDWEPEDAITRKVEQDRCAH